MDSEIIYSLIGISILILVIIFTLGRTPKKQVKTKEEKRNEIINEYKNKLKKDLAPLLDNKEATLAKKNELLKKFSNELALNIFFDKSEIKDIILELSKESNN
jgi:hypothetical protein